MDYTNMEENNEEKTMMDKIEIVEDVISASSNQHKNYIRFKRTDKFSYSNRLTKDNDISSDTDISKINKRYYTIFLVDENNKNILSEYKDEIVASFNDDEAIHFMELNIRSLKILEYFSKDYWGYLPSKHIFRTNTIFDDALLCEKTDNGILLYNIKRFNEDIEYNNKNRIKSNNLNNNINYFDGYLRVVSKLIVRGRLTNGYDCKGMRIALPISDITKAEEIIHKALSKIDEESMNALSSIIDKIL